MVSPEQVMSDGKSEMGWQGIYKIGGIAALVVGLILAVALIPVPSIFQENFLVLIFKLHAGITGIQEASLEGFHPLDFCILMLVGMIFLALYPILIQTNKTWAMIATRLPFIGLVLYIITQDIGRSGILAAGFVVAFILLKNDNFSKKISYLGILANGCLLIGDIGIVFGYGKSLVLFIGVGYIVLILWFGLISWRLFQISEDPRPMIGSSS